MTMVDTLQAPELFGFVFLAVLTILLLKHLQLTPFKQRRNTSPSLPRPRGLPLIGNLHQLGALPHASLAALAEKHGAPLMLLRLGSVPTLVVSTADAVRAAFQANDRAMSGRPALRAATVLSYGRQDITFSAPDDPFWRAARRMCLSEIFGAPRVRGFRDAREAEAAALIAAIANASRRNGSPVNLSDMLVETSNRIVRRVAFGEDNGEAMADETRALIDETQNLLGTFFVSDYIPWLGCLDTLRGLGRWQERLFRKVDAICERVIADHLDKRGGVGTNNNKEEEDLVDVLLRLHDDPAHRSTFGSRSRVKAILLDMFLAGTDTSAAAVEWTMTELVRHPDILARARDEVRRVVGGDGSRDMVRESDLPHLHYLKLVIRESLRLHPPVPLLVPRETTEPCTVQGFAVPAGTRVLVNAVAIGRDPGAWGPDAARFVPERHDSCAGGGGGAINLSDHKPWHDSFALVPFGIGRRSCPAVHFATAAVELLLANLLYGFDWSAPHGHVDVEEASGLVVRRKNPLVLVAERRSL